MDYSYREFQKKGVELYTFNLLLFGFHFQKVQMNSVQNLHIVHQKKKGVELYASMLGAALHMHAINTSLCI